MNQEPRDPVQRRKAREKANVQRGIKARAKVVADIRHVWESNTGSDFVAAMRGKSFSSGLLDLWYREAPVYFDVSPIAKQQDFNATSIFLTTELDSTVADFFVSQLENLGYHSVTAIGSELRSGYGNEDKAQLHLIVPNDLPAYED